MRISRIFTEQDLAPDSALLLDDRTSHYLIRVLKLRVGSPLVVFNGDGFDYSAELVSVQKKGARISISTRLPALAESGLHITLVQAISRGERMDFSLQKATELGVAAIRLVITERVEVKLDHDRMLKRMSHWRGVITSACEQSGRSRVPMLYSPLSLDDWASTADKADRLVLVQGAEQSLSAQSLSFGQAEILIGPEGGLSEAELERLVLAGIRPVSLGPRVLRTETAGPAAIAVMQSVAGDF